MTQQRVQRPRSQEAKSEQTKAAREKREEQRGYIYACLRTIFESGMAQRKWESRAEAARWLTEESELVSEDFYGYGVVGLVATADTSRGYSRDLYNKLKEWELESKLEYRPKGEPAPVQDPGSIASVLRR